MSDNPIYPDGSSRNEESHPSTHPFPVGDETIRVWCCQTKVTGPHMPDCTFQPDDGSLLPEVAAHHELFLRDLRHILNAHGWDNTLNIADNLLAEWILGELQGLKWVTHSANLTPSPRDIKFRLPKFRPPPPETAAQLAKQFRDLLPKARITEVPPDAMTVELNDPTRCSCAEQTLAYGQNVKLVGGVRHRRNDPCYGISSADEKQND